MRKSEIERSYHNGTEGLPMVNVKQYRWDLTVEEVESLRGEFPFLPADNRRAHNLLVDVVEEYEWVVDAGRELGWEYLQSDAEGVYDDTPYAVQVWSQGRSGGWAVVHGLPDVDEWDAIMVAKWAKFAKWARQHADGIAYQAACIACQNILEPKHEANLAEQAEDAAALVPVLLNL
jgi:hypothetical protein